MKKHLDNIKLIIFDWDDVITIGSIRGYYKCYEETLSELGIDMDADEMKKRLLVKWGQSHREEFEVLLFDRMEYYDRACSIYVEKLFGPVFADCLSLVKGTSETLLRLKDSFILAVATGASHELIRKSIMPRLGIPDVFSAIISAYQIIDPLLHKPHPHMVNTLLDQFNMQQNQAIVVGDSEKDIIMAKAACVTSVAVLSGHLTREEAEKIDTDFIINDITALESILH